MIKGGTTLIYLSDKAETLLPASCVDRKHPGDLKFL